MSVRVYVFVLEDMKLGVVVFLETRMHAIHPYLSNYIVHISYRIHNNHSYDKQWWGCQQRALDSKGTLGDLGVFEILGVRLTLYVLVMVRIILRKVYKLNQLQLRKSKP